MIYRLIYKDSSWVPDDRVEFRYAPFGSMGIRKAKSLYEYISDKIENIETKKTLDYVINNRLEKNGAIKWHPFIWSYKCKNSS